MDVLGFADLVEQDEIASVRWAAGLSSLRASMKTRPPSPLAMLFDAFHGAIENALQTADNPNLQKPLRYRPPAIVFSDSAFVVMPWLHMAINVARQLMRELILARVPARMGVAFGGFSASRFSTETRRQYTHHVSEFYGTAVVRAHRAESCGVAGMRILLHPSVVRRIEATRLPADFPLDKPMPSATELALPEPAPRNGVTHELTYLLGDDTDDQLRLAVMEMKARAPSGFLAYYDDTLAAHERMRSAK